VNSKRDKPMSKFIVLAIIENKVQLNDPEGETIHRDLVIKGGYERIESVRTAKTLKMRVRAKTQDDAEKLVRTFCDELRIYNPVVSDCEVKCTGLAA